MTTTRQPDRRHPTFEGMWPVVVGAATKEQAKRVIDDHLLNPIVTHASNIPGSQGDTAAPSPEACYESE